MYRVGTMFGMFKILDELQTNENERERYITTLAGVFTEDTTIHKEIFDHLYGCLSILDSKSASLLSFNAITSTIFSIYISDLSRTDYRIFIIVGIFLTLTSSLILLLVVRIRWSTQSELECLDCTALQLLYIRNKRTVLYRISWLLSFSSIVILMLWILLELFSKL
ncbi:MAG: hypothetical protein HW380_3976 [Magnetococcales bacterium]|nr:hypothetical protein [Magnetococcales bacterium]